MQTSARLILISIFIFIAQASQAQYYEQAAGIRLGYSSGLSYKLLFDEEQGIELSLTGREEGLIAGGLFIHHRPLTEIGAGNLFLYYGGGLHLGLIQEDFFRVNQPDQPVRVEERTYFVMGADGVAGVEYRLLGAPVAISWDIKPFVEQVGFRDFRFRFWDTALTLRYTFR